ncbi:MAG: hypothetical protein WD830_11605 [Chloroflexota bacterium]
MNLPRIRWWEAHPLRLAKEQRAMAEVAPALTWTEELFGSSGGGWVGLCPAWPFVRPQPSKLDGFLLGRGFTIQVRLSPAHPVVAPTVYPVDPEPDLWVRTRQAWHVLGDGGLCLLRETLDWTAAEPAAELVRKAAAWFLEYLLLTDGVIEEMTRDGIVDDDKLDHLFVPRREEVA